MRRGAKKKIEVGLLGATGMVGQRFVAMLAGHPWFRLTWLAASERSSGKKYGEIAWRLSVPMPSEAAELTIEAPEPGKGPMVFFSALDASVAGEIETRFAAAGHTVVSNARNHRMDPLVPLVIPEVNAEHLAILPAQKKRKGWRGALVTNPNCSTIGFAIALAALRELEPRRVLVTTLQAVSGAGYPGVASLDILGNVIPAVVGEEEKMERETKKILGELAGDKFRDAAICVSAQTTRVPVINGHTETVSVGFDEEASTEDIREAFRKFSGKPQEFGLPTAPKNAIVYSDLPDRPQPRLDAERFGGMTVHVGRLRPCPVLGHKFVVLSHNTIRGAAGAAVLNAELMRAEGLIQ